MPGASPLLKAMETNSGPSRSTQWKALQIPLAPLISKMENISTTPRSADNQNHFTSFEQERPCKCTSKDREPHDVTLLKRGQCHWSIVKSTLVLSSLRYEGCCLHSRYRTRSRWVNRWQFNSGVQAELRLLGQLWVLCLLVPWHTPRVIRWQYNRVPHNFIVRWFWHHGVQVRVIYPFFSLVCLVSSQNEFSWYDFHTAMRSYMASVNFINV